MAHTTSSNVTGVAPGSTRNGAALDMRQQKETQIDWGGSRSAEYAISTAQTALALASLPATRRNAWWTLAMLAPLAAAGIREKIRAVQLKRAFSAAPLAAPTLAGLVGTGILLYTRTPPPARRRACRCPR